MNDPWFHPEWGDRYLTDEEWAEATEGMPCTCEITGQALCWVHTRSRQKIHLPPEE